MPAPPLALEIAWLEPIAAYETVRICPRRLSWRVPGPTRG